MSFSLLLDEIKLNLKRITGELEIEQIDFDVTPAKPGFGDVTSNLCFLLARHLKKKPGNIAHDLAKRYGGLESNLVQRCEPHSSGYLNFFANWNKLNDIILTASVKQETDFVDVGNKQSITVEHTSVNPNKALHIGHVRNIVIGDTICRILEHANFDVKVLNYVDDSGLQVADIVVGFKMLGFTETPPDGKKFDQYCGDMVYVKTTEKYDHDPSLQDTRKQVLKEIEDDVYPTADFADKITKRVLDCQLETCWNLGVEYDCLNYESQIVRSGLWKNVFEKLKTLKLVKYETEGKNSGCWVIPDSGGEEDKVLVRSNGTATYIAKDIPYAAWKLGLLEDPFNYVKYPKKQPGKRTLWQTSLKTTNSLKIDFSGERVITVIDSRQARLQKIVANLMAKFKSDENAYNHLAYESVTLSSDTAKMLGIDTKGKNTQMSGRKGLYVNADEVYEFLKNKIAEETKKRNPELEEESISKISHDVAVGTIRYEMIKQDLDKIITFDMEKSTSLEGDTGPYLQYTSARASRILEKAKTTPRVEICNLDLIQSEHEKNLVRQIGLFSSNIEDAIHNLSPKVIAKYSYSLAVLFNSFYEHVRVLDLDDKQLENSRLCLVLAFKKTMTRALGLLGIAAPQRM